MKEHFRWLIVFFVGIIIGFIVGRATFTSQKQEGVMVTDHHINLILPKTEADLKRQLLYNAVSQTMLLEMLKLDLIKVSTKEADKKFEIKPGRKDGKN